MWVPDAENQASLRLSAPSRNNWNYTRPPCRLENAGKSLHYHKIKHRVDVVSLCVAEWVAEEAGEKHSKGKEIAKRDTFCYHAREKHGDGVTKEEAGVEEAEKGGSIGTIWEEMINTLTLCYQK